jgi:DNA-binding transcriptional regulator YdaS (Cro superfamily)
MAKNDKLWQEFNVSGAAQATLASLDRNYNQAILAEILGWEGIKPQRSVVSGMPQPTMRDYSTYYLKRGLAVNPIEGIRIINEWAETVTRLGEFAKARGAEYGKMPWDFWKKKGMKIPTERESMLKSAHAAREITVDFWTMGAATRQLNMVAAFWNASMQGNARLARTFRDHPWRSAYRSFVSVTLPSIILQLINQDDPEYHKLSDFKKNLFWNIPLGRGANHWWVRVPKPHILGLMTGSLVERMMEWHYDRDPHTFDELKRNMLNEVNPIPDITALVLYDEWKHGYSRWTGQSNQPYGAEYLPPEEQYKIGQVGETSKAVGRLMNVSPAKIEQFARGSAGGTGIGTLRAIDIAGEVTGVLPPRQLRPGQKRYDWTKVPGLSRFLQQRPPGVEATDREWQTFSAGRALKARERALEKKGSKADLEHFRREWGAQLQYYLDNEEAELKEKFLKRKEPKPYQGRQRRRPTRKRKGR